MKRFHVHVAVHDLDTSIKFYSKLFGHAPTMTRPDYAKWLLDDPRVNFAISARGNAPGLNHLGMQAETPEELRSLRDQARAAADGGTLDEASAQCCYAVSDKHWTVDPQGIAWEQFHTMAQAAQFGTEGSSPKGACCIPLRSDTA